MLAIVLGGAPTVWAEAEAAMALLGQSRRVVVAANLAGIHYDGRLDAWATLHPDLLPEWAAARRGNRDFAAFTPPRTPERWDGSSGLYATQVALFELGAGGVILCGIPMDQGAGHFCNPGAWAPVTSYRQAFVAALPLIGGRVRSMGGWTADLYGRPSAAWVTAIVPARPLAQPGRNPSKSPNMHKVKNTSDKPKTFKVFGEDGDIRNHTLGAGESGEFEINPAMGVFAEGGDLEVTEVFPPLTAEDAEQQNKPAARRGRKPDPAEDGETTPPAEGA